MRAHHVEIEAILCTLGPFFGRAPYGARRRTVPPVPSCSGDACPPGEGRHLYASQTGRLATVHVCEGMGFARWRKKRLAALLFAHQNVRGLRRDEKKEELFASLKARGVFAATLQETWLSGNDSLERSRYVAVCSGLEPSEHGCNRGRLGVAVVLSPEAAEAWRDSGGFVVRASARAIGVRLTALDDEGRAVGLFIVSAYAPVGQAPEAEWMEFFDAVDTVLREKRQSDVLVMGMDGNSSIGVRSPGAALDALGPQGLDVCGPHGVAHVNNAGRRLRSFLATRSLASVGTFFEKSEHATWLHPASCNLHQIDHIVASQCDLIRFIDAGVTGNLVDSDHRALKGIIRIKLRLKRPANVRDSSARLDYAPLRSPEAVGVKRELCSVAADKFQQASATAADGSTRSTYARLQEAVRAAAAAVLGRVRRCRPGWFEAASNILRPLIERRNSCHVKVMSLRTRRGLRSTSSVLDAHRRARAELRKAVAKAKDDWMIALCEDLNAGSESLGGTSKYWETIGRLRAGLVKTRPSRQVRMQKADGTRCESPRENADVFKVHFEKLYARRPEFDASVLDDVDQRPVRLELGDPPTDEEITRAASSLNFSAAGESGVRAEVWKAIAGDARTFPLLRRVVLELWESEEQPAEWDVGLLGILPKKGDLSQPGNYRGIMMLEVAQKIVSNIARSRLSLVCEELDHESQCGFRPGRGTSDATFSLKLALKKRREHGLETWVLFVDFVKAFDRVPRELLWDVLLKFGVPPKLVAVVRCLHRITVRFSVAGAEAEIESIIGVKQGDVLGPVLFVLYMAALMMSWRRRYGGQLCVYRTKEDFVLTGRPHTRRGTELAVSDSEYADDAALLFCSREDVDTHSPRFMKHCADWGMEVHAGDRRAGKASKTEVLFVAAPGILYDDLASYDDADLSDVDLGDGRFFPVVDEFNYLGSVLTRDCRDASDVDTRIKKASAAFGALRDSVFASKTVSSRAKRTVYVALVLAILFHGAESWCLTEAVFQRLRCFHAQCARAMCRVTLKHSREHFVSTASLLQSLGLESIDVYVTRRQLRWAGHVARMPFHRLPRKMLSSWCYAKRPIGSPQMTYGRGLYKALAKCNIPRDTWSQRAQNRTQWRSSIYEFSSLSSSSTV